MKRTNKRRLPTWLELRDAERARYLDARAIPVRVEVAEMGKEELPGEVVVGLEKERGEC